MTNQRGTFLSHHASFTTQAPCCEYGETKRMLTAVHPEPGRPFAGTQNGPGTTASLYAVPFFGGDDAGGSGAGDAAGAPTCESPHFEDAGATPAHIAAGDPPTSSSTGGGGAGADAGSSAVPTGAGSGSGGAGPEYTVAGVGARSGGSDLYTVVAVARPDQRTYAPAMIGNTNPPYVPPCVPRIDRRAHPRLPLRRPTHSAGYR